MLNGTVLFVIMLYAALALWLLYRDGLIRKPWTAVLCAVLVAAALAARASVFDMQTGDYRDWLARWMSYYRENGGFRAFRELPPYCNYHVPYLYFLALFSYLRVPELYLIKLLSIFSMCCWPVMPAAISSGVRGWNFVATTTSSRFAKSRSALPTNCSLVPLW